MATVRLLRCIPIATTRSSSCKQVSPLLAYRTISTENTAKSSGDSLFSKRSPPANSRNLSSEVLISTNSWASERLQEKGEKLEKSSSTTSFISDDNLSNPSAKIKNLSDEILSLNMVEVNQLLKALTTRLGISDDEINVHSYGRVGGGGGGGAAKAAVEEEAPPPEPVKEKEAFDLKLVSVDAKAKIKIIKEVRTITNLGLKEAKDLVEKAPTVVKQGLKKEEAEAFKKLLTEAGAVVELI